MPTFPVDHSHIGEGCMEVKRVGGDGGGAAAQGFPSSLFISDSVQKRLFVQFFPFFLHCLSANSWRCLSFFAGGN